MNSFKLQNRINYELKSTILKNLDVNVIYSGRDVFLKFKYKNLDITLNGYSYPFHVPEILINDINYKKLLEFNCNNNICLCCKSIINQNNSFFVIKR